METQKRNNILIIEDVVAEANILKLYLKEDYNVSIACDGRSGVEMALKDPPDLILLDIMMPKMDGYEVFYSLKENERTKNIPIIFITSKIEEKDEVMGLELGANDYIRKPFSIPIIKARVKNFMQLKKHQDMLEELLSIDALTGIPNRRGFDQMLAQEWRRAMRKGTYLSLIMMDIDFFKKYNDYYGHVAGDECLKSVAQAIDRSLNRSQDFVARYGGEEFSIILPETLIDGAFIMGEKIRQNVKNLNIPHTHSLVSDCITISAGISSIAPRKNMAPDILIKGADIALYKAKQESRDACKRYCDMDVQK